MQAQYWPTPHELPEAPSGGNGGAFQETYFERLLRAKAQAQVGNTTGTGPRPPIVPQSSNIASSSSRFEQLLKAKLAAEKSAPPPSHTMIFAPIDIVREKLQHADTVANPLFVAPHYYPGQSVAAMADAQCSDRSYGNPDIRQHVKGQGQGRVGLSEYDMLSYRAVDPPVVPNPAPWSTLR